MPWIKVSDHLPPNDEPVLAWGCGFIEIGWYDQEDKLWYTDNFTYDKDEVTHWTPLPEPPKEG